nr:hypothetical protein [Nanoarchaeum sp.]
MFRIFKRKPVESVRPSPEEIRLIEEQREREEIQREINDFKNHFAVRDWEVKRGGLFYSHYDGNIGIQLALAKAEIKEAREYFNLPKSEQTSEGVRHYTKSLKHAKRFVSKCYNLKPLQQGRSDVEVKHNTRLSQFYANRAHVLEEMAGELVERANSLYGTAQNFSYRTNHMLLLGSRLRVTRDPRVQARDIGEKYRCIRLESVLTKGLKEKELSIFGAYFNPSIEHFPEREEFHDLNKIITRENNPDLEYFTRRN